VRQRRMWEVSEKTGSAKSVAASQFF
jgi:hypothetical protein